MNIAERIAAEQIPAASGILGPLEYLASAKPTSCSAVWVEATREVIMHGKNAADRLAEAVGFGEFRPRADGVAGHAVRNGSALAAGALLGVRAAALR